MIIGLGGFFIKAKDPKFLSRWYEDNFGMPFGNKTYCTFHWSEIESGKHRTTTFSFMPESTTYFLPSTSDVMINLITDQLDNLLVDLKKQGVNVLDKVEDTEYGRFGWVIDIDGIKIELWENEGEAFQLDSPLRSTVMPGGVFIKSKNQNELMQWYSTHFGFSFEHSSHLFRWKTFDIPVENKKTIFSIFPETSSYFLPSEKNFMINIQVDDVESVIRNLSEKGEQIIGKIDNYDYGKFSLCLDPEGNKIELWQPSKKQEK